MSRDAHVSCRIHGDGTRASRSSTSRMWPVSPMPPTVARKRSARSVREHSTVSPAASSMRSARTWRPMEPSTWWFLPWTSAATMPPSVTNWVPGVTGGNQPRGRKLQTRSRSARPASARSRPVAGSNARMRSASREPATTVMPGGGSAESP